MSESIEEFGVAVESILIRYGTSVVGKQCLERYYLHQVNEVSIGGDYEIGHSVRHCVRVSVYMSLRCYISIMVPDRCMVTM